MASQCIQGHTSVLCLEFPQCPHLGWFGAGGTEDDAASSGAVGGVGSPPKRFPGCSARWIVSRLAFLFPFPRLFGDGCKAGHITSWYIRNVIHVLVRRRHMMNTRGRSRTFGNGPRRFNLHLGSVVKCCRWTTRTGLGLRRLRVPQRCRVRGL